MDISGADDTEGTITAARYTGEPEEETSLSVGTGTTGVFFLDVKVTGYTSGTAHITVPYPDVAPDDGIVDGTSIVESSLGLYYWDEADSMWHLAANNAVDTALFMSLKYAGMDSEEASKYADGWVVRNIKG